MAGAVGQGSVGSAAETDRARPGAGSSGGETEDDVSGVQSVGVGATASVLGAQFLPVQGAAGHAAKVALAATGFAAGAYVLFAAVLIVIGAVMRWVGMREARR